jgi:hypothetical protein
VTLQSRARRGPMVLGAATVVALLSFLAGASAIAKPSHRTPRLAPCDGAILTGRFVPDDAGFMLGGVVFSNTSAQACTLRGWPYIQSPGMQGRWGDGWWEYLKVPSTPNNSPPPMPKVVLRPRGGSEAGIHLAWRNWCNSSQPSALVLHFEDTHAPAITVPVPPGIDVAAYAPCTNPDDAATTMYESVVRRYDSTNGFHDTSPRPNRHLVARDESGKIRVAYTVEER